MKGSWSNTPAVWSRQEAGRAAIFAALEEEVITHRENWLSDWVSGKSMAGTQAFP